MKKFDDLEEVNKLVASRNAKADGFIIVDDIIKLIPMLNDEEAIKKAIQLLVEIVRERNTTIAIPSKVLNCLSSDRREELRQLISRMEAVSSRASISKHPHYSFEYNDIVEFSKTYFHRKIPPFIRRDSVIAALGSCFAVNVTSHLQSMGYNATVGKMAEHINNSYTNLSLMRSFFDENIFDVIFNKSGINDEVRDSFINYRDAVLKSDVVIYTLGLSYAFYEKETGKALTNPIQSYSSSTYRNFVMKPISISENINNIHEIIILLRRVRPNATIVFSLSPIPLDGILDYNQSVIEVDCLSKSIGRVTLAEVESNKDKFGSNIVYFPSFEIARWVACNQDTPLFGGNDGWARHLDDKVVNAIMEVFTDFYCVKDPA